MAGRLKEFTGIDPLTIDQQQWTEQGQVAKKHPLYRAINIQEASVFVDATGQVYPGLGLGRTDIQVAHPRTRYRYSRPSWLLLGGQRKPCLLKSAQCRLKLPCLVQAYRLDEVADSLLGTRRAIPVDVIEVTRWADRKALILPAGK